MELGRIDTRSFYKNGFATISPDQYTTSELDELKVRAQGIIRESDLKGASIFTTNEQTRHSDKYFLDSAHSVRCFFEEEGKSQEIPLEERINKIGHNLHNKEPLFKRFCDKALQSGLLAKIGYKKPIIAQSMYIFKQPRIGGAVHPHRDGTFIRTTPHSCLALWWAADECNQNNGCLWVKPGSHKEKITRYFQKDPESESVTFTGEPESDDLSGYIPVECPKGTLVIMDGGLLHYSKKNTSSHPRHAFSLHAVESEGTSWHPLNWIFRLF